MATRIAVLGPTAAEVDGRPVQLRSVRQRRLLAALVLWREGASTSRLADAVWGDALPGDPSAALANLVSRLRTLLGVDAIRGIAGGYRLGPDVVCDVDRLEEHAVAETSRGAPYEDLDVEDAQIESARVTERVVALREGRAEELLRDGDAPAAAALGAALTREHPLRERGALVLAEALASMGRRAEALRELDQLRTRLARELGIDPSSEVVAAHRRLLGGFGPIVQRRPVHTAGALVGRDDLISEVTQALRTDRLVTLTGPGGVGKTALALAVGEHAGTEIIDFVALGPVHGDDQVVATVAARLGIDRGEDVPLVQRITDVLAYDSGTLVLDNAEHVRAGVTGLVGELLTRTPVRLLVTSRVALGLANERVIEVRPLDTSHDEGGPACELFVVRAKGARSGWSPTDRRSIVGVCRRLDGLPLAIEIAAAHLATRSLPELVAQLDEPRELLGDPPLGGVGLRSVVARSLRLLDPVDRSILEHAAAFPGGVGVDTLCSACREFADASVVRAAADRLVRASLLSRTERGDGSRFGMLETIRTFVLDGTDAESEADIRRRHAQAMLELFEHGVVDAYGPGERDWAERLLDERSNVQLAVEHLIARSDATGAARLAIAAYLIGMPRRHVDFGDLVAAATRMAELADLLEPDLLVELFGLAADAAAYSGDSSTARGLIDAARGVGASFAAHRYCHAVSADLALYSGDIETAVDELESARTGFDDMDQPALSAWMAATVALARSYARPDDQVENALVALGQAERTACPSTIGFARYVYAEVLRHRDPDEARRQHELALDEAISVGAYFVAALVRLSLATDSMERGDLQRSATLFNETITEWLRLGNWAQQVITLRAAALLLDTVGQHTASLAVLLSLDALTTETVWARGAADLEPAPETVRTTPPRRDVADSSEVSQHLDRSSLVAFAIAELQAILSATGAR